MLGSQGTYLKRKPWEESINVPGIVHYPAAVREGAETNLPFSHVDIVPTLLGLARLPIPEMVSGRNLAEHLFIEEQGGVAEGTLAPESVYLQSYTPTEQSEFPAWRGVRTERYTYARHKESAWLLYDNDSDPFQKQNLVGKPEHAELQAKLDAMTMDWFNQTGDNWRDRSDLPYR